MAQLEQRFAKGGQQEGVFRGVSASAVLRRLWFVWISHHHADHCGGVLCLAEKWSEAKAAATMADGRAPRPVLPLIAPPAVLSYVSEAGLALWGTKGRGLGDEGRMRRKEGAGGGGRGTAGVPKALDVRNGTARLELLPIAAFRAFASPVSDRIFGRGRCFPLQGLRSVRVEHCRDAYGVVVDFDGQALGTGHQLARLVYSGDTRPCEALVAAARAGSGSGNRHDFLYLVLIHEATFDDDLSGDAVRKRHSTTGEAISIGASMGAMRVMLTHFSQRYPAIIGVPVSLSKKARAKPG